MATHGFCFKCRDDREMVGEQEITMDNGRPAVEGKCPVCGTRIFRFGKPKP